MVSFVCNHCQQTLKKPKLDPHTYSCRNANFTCIDCNTDFYGTDYRSHTSCISEAQKYQKSLYKGNKNAAKPQPPKKDIIPTQNKVIPTATSDKKRPSESEPSDNKKQKVDTSSDTESAKAKKDCNKKVEDLTSIIQNAIKAILTEKPKIKFSKLQSKVGKKVKKSANNLSKEDALKAIEKHILEALKKDEFTLSLHN